MSSLDDARNFVKEKRTSGDKTEYRIGIVKRSTPSMCPTGKKKGDVVIFTVHDPSKASDREKLYWERDHSGDPVTLTVETPYSPDVVEENKANGNYVFSHGAIVNVPSGYVRDIRTMDYMSHGLKKLLGL